MRGAPHYRGVRSEGQQGAGVKVHRERQAVRGGDLSFGDGQMDAQVDSGACTVVGGGGGANPIIKGIGAPRICARVIDDGTRGQVHGDVHCLPAATHQSKRCRRCEGRVVFGDRDCDRGVDCGHGLIVSDGERNGHHDCAGAAVRAVRSFAGLVLQPLIPQEARFGFEPNLAVLHPCGSMCCSHRLVRVGRILTERGTGAQQAQS